MRKTKPLNFVDYPFIWNHRRPIKEQVTLEAETLIKDYPREVLLYNSLSPRMKLTPANIVALAHDMVKSMLP